MVQQRSREIRNKIALAKSQADAQDQEFQRKERQFYSKFRREVSNALSLNGNKLDIVKEWQLQQDKRRSGTGLSVYSFAPKLNIYTFIAS